MSAFAERLAAVGADIEAELDALLGPEALKGEPAVPPRLLEAMRYGVLSGAVRCGAAERAGSHWVGIGSTPVSVVRSGCSNNDSR